MTSIGKSDGGPLRQWADGFASRDDDVGRKNERRDSVRSGLNADAGPDLLDAGGLARVAAFEKSFRDAARNLNGETSGDTSPDDPNAEPRLIAVAEGLITAGLPIPAVVAAAPVAAVEQAASTQAVVDLVTERIQRAILAEVTPIAGKPLNLHIMFGEGVEGLTGIRLVMTPSTLDVVLERNGAELASELASAAQMLADRLAMRFAKQRVRILDQPASASGEADGETWTMSKLFLPPAG
jgi:hypothetical protein